MFQIEPSGVGGSFLSRGKMVVIVSERYPLEVREKAARLVMERSDEHNNARLHYVLTTSHPLGMRGLLHSTPATPSGAGLNSKPVPYP